MAIFNYAKTYGEVSNLLNATPGTTGDYIKFAITGDGHIISHGTDYLPWSHRTDGSRYWDIRYLNIDDKDHSSDSTLWTSKTIKDLIAQSFIANDAMRFKGTLGFIKDASGNITYQINNQNAAFPSATALVGDTYRIVTGGTYAGNVCEIGDLLICITAGSTSTAATWTVAQTNINGQVTHIVNNVAHKVYSTDSQSFTIYAPTTAGTSTQVLISQGAGKAPVWTNQSNIVAGDLIDSVKKGLFTNLNYSNDILSITIGGTNKTVTIRGRRAINVNSKEVLSTSVATALNLVNGNGTTAVWDSTNNQFKYNINTNFTTSGKDYAVKVASDGNLYVNVPWTNSVYDVVSKDQNGLAPKLINTNSTQINQNFYLLASIDGQTTPSWYRLPNTAFSNTWRAIKVGNIDIGSKTLRFMPSGTIYAKTNDQITSTDEFDLSFDIAWYNISEKQYEYE